MPELLGSYLAVVLTPQIAARAKAGSLKRFYHRAQGALLAAAVPAYAVALSLWDAVAPAVLPPEFLLAARIALILLPGTLAALVTVPLALPVVMFWRKTWCCGWIA